MRKVRKDHNPRAARAVMAVVLLKVAMVVLLHSKITASQASASNYRAVTDSLHLAKDNMDNNPAHMASGSNSNSKPPLVMEGHHRINLRMVARKVARKVATGLLRLHQGAERIS